MADRDLTPAEARAEIEAFMGEGWRVTFVRPPDFPDRIYACAWLPCVRAGDFKVRVESPCCLTARAAVDALKAAWRDAVRPWCVECANEGHNDVDRHGNIVEGAGSIVARVLKEDSHG